MSKTANTLFFIHSIALKPHGGPVTSKVLDERVAALTDLERKAWEEVATHVHFSYERKNNGVEETTDGQEEVRIGS